MACQLAKFSLLMLIRQGLAFKVQGSNGSLSTLGKGSVVEALHYSAGCKIQNIFNDKDLAAGDLNNWCRDRVASDGNYELNVGQYCTQYASNPNVKFTCLDKTASSFQAEFSEETGCWYPGPSGCSITCTSGCKIRNILSNKGLEAGELNNWCRDRVNSNPDYELNYGQYCTQYASNPNVKFTCNDKTACSFNEEFTTETGCWYGCNR